MLNNIKNFIFFKIASIAGYVYASILALIFLYWLYIWITEDITSFLIVEILSFGVFFVFSFFTLLITDVLIIIFLLLKKKSEPKQISKTKEFTNKSMFVFYIILSLGIKLLFLFITLFTNEFSNLINYLGEEFYQFSYTETWKELTNCENGCKLPQH